MGQRAGWRLAGVVAWIGTFLLVAHALPQTSPLPGSADRPILFEEDFSKKLGPDGIPVGWRLKQWAGGTPDIRIEPGTGSGSNALHLTSDNNSFGVYKEFKFDAKKYPVLRWRWKAALLPEGGDVRKKETDDQAAQVYVTFPRFPSWAKARLIGYIWENKTPKDLKVTSQKSSRTKYIVLESGSEKLNQWVEEERNIYEDYKTLFGEEPPQAGGIALMIDSDDTQSRAESFFDSIRIEKSGTAPNPIPK